MCVNGVIGNYTFANTFASTNPTDYDTVKQNCAYLSPVCNMWASNGNAYAKSQLSTGGDVTVCGTAKVGYNASEGVASTDDNRNLIQVCGLQPVDPLPTIQPPAIPQQTNNHIIVAIFIVIVILTIYWFYG
jgi:hypothetical protein